MNEYFVGRAAIARLVFAFAFLGLGLVAARTETPIFWLMLGWSAALVIALATLGGLAPGVLAAPALDLRRALLLLRDGFPIVLQGLLRFGLVSIDKLVVYILASPAAVGFYGIGVLAAGVTGLFGAMVARVSLPTLLRLRARGDSDIQSEFERMLNLIQTLGLTVILPVCAFSPLFVHVVLPAYQPATWTIGILAVAGGFTGLGQALNDVTMSLGVKRQVLVSTVAALVMEGVLLAVAWACSGAIEGVALAVLGTMLFLSGRSAWLGFRALGFSVGEARVRLGVLAVRSAISIAACLGLIALQEAAIALLPDSVMPVLALNAVLALLAAGALWYGLLVRRRRNGSGQGESG